MAGEENLKPFGKNSPLTVEQQRAIQSAGGKASAEARKERKKLADMLDDLLCKDFDIKDKNGNVTGQQQGIEAIATNLFRIASKGKKEDAVIKAIALIRDTVGEKPIDKVAVASVDADTMAEVEQMVKDAERTEE